jgi:peptidoglycan-associated lipoprotein
MAFFCASVLLMASCASQQVQVSEEPAVEEPKVVEEAKEAPATREAEEVKEPAEEEKEEPSDIQAREAERQARLRELAEQQRLADEIGLFESENIYFDFDKSDLRPESKAILRQKAEWLRYNPSYWVRIEGHCDERGTNEYNLALGERRAHSAMKYLMALGIAENRISTISYGEERPADPRSNEEAWGKNRRDEFKVIE